MSSKTIVLATHNAGKVREFRTLLEPLGFTCLSAHDLNLPEPDETGTMFAENARLKAISAAEKSGYTALSDDSGLCVNGLDGAPGIFSARWAVNKNFAAALQRVQEELEQRAIAPEAWRAHFVAALVWRTPEGEEILAEGRVHGQIVWPPRGNLGFGYDPIFQPEDHDRTFGEMNEAEKHGLHTVMVNGLPQKTGLSHRARALGILLGRL
jgi:XTP/dITP diphosphohydrolase